MKGAGHNKGQNNQYRALGTDLGKSCGGQVDLLRQASVFVLSQWQRQGHKVETAQQRLLLPAGEGAGELCPPNAAEYLKGVVWSQRLSIASHSVP